LWVHEADSGSSQVNELFSIQACGCGLGGYSDRSNLLPVLFTLGVDPVTGSP